MLTVLGIIAGLIILGSPLLRQVAAFFVGIALLLGGLLFLVFVVDMTTAFLK